MTLRDVPAYFRVQWTPEGWTVEKLDWEGEVPGPDEWVSKNRHQPTAEAAMQNMGAMMDTLDEKLTEIESGTDLEAPPFKLPMERKTAGAGKIEGGLK